MTGALAFDDGDLELVRVRVPAKINLHLGVGDRRPDGYHELTTVYQAISLHDEISLASSEEEGVHVEVTGVSEGVPRDESNLAVRAIRLLAEHAGIKPAVSLRLAKRIPVAGGLAGGSADAAGTLLAATKLWGLGIPRAELLGLAAKLGSDVPFCLAGGTALGSGHGEKLSEIITRGRYHWVVATSQGQISTPAAYAEVDRLRANGVGRYSSNISDLVEALATGRPEALATMLCNDMTDAALSLRPELAEIIAAGHDDGALATLVSGSGPTILYLARDEHHAHALAGRLRMRRLADGVHHAHGPVPGAMTH